MTAAIVAVVVAVITAGPMWISSMRSDRRMRRENTEQHAHGQELIAGLTTASHATATAVGEVKGLLEAHIENPAAHAPAKGQA